MPQTMVTNAKVSTTASHMDDVPALRAWWIHTAVARAAPGAALRGGYTEATVRKASIGDQTLTVGWYPAAV
ncbi:hypothetical protein [Streptomyces sp. NPDC088360]|uniref:hypothetical protein n=1 Tax=Streptomyces sp. NPDC088360 TaxID=3154515 RepID=UPI00344B4DD4